MAPVGSNGTRSKTPAWGVILTALALACHLLAVPLSSRMAAEQLARDGLPFGELCTGAQGAGHTPDAPGTAHHDHCSLCVAAACAVLDAAAPVLAAPLAMGWFVAPLLKDGVTFVRKISVHRSRAPPQTF